MATDGRIAIISDIHSSLEALQTVLDDIGKRKDVLEILCPGDVVGYGPNPNEACDMVRGLGCSVVQGNHDLGINLENLGWFNRFAKKALTWTSEKLTGENRRWLLGLPQIHEEKTRGKKIVVVHGSPDDPLYEYVHPDTPARILKDYIKQTGADILIMGHTHAPFVKKVGGSLVINAGSVGQPRDRDPRACWVLLDPRGMKAEIVRVNYDIETCARKIRKNGLPEFLAERLQEGI